MYFLILLLILGLAICLRKYHQVNQQLTEILNVLPQFERVNSLPKVAQVRRNVNLLNKDFQKVIYQLKVYQDLLEVAPIGYLKIDEFNYLIECNQYSRDLLLIQRWQPQKFRLFLELVRSYELDQLIQQTRKLQQNLEIEWHFFPSNDYALDQENNQNKKNLPPIFLKAHSIPLLEDKVAIFIINQQLVYELIKRKDEAYSDLSHELRTPLTSLSLLAETLIEETEGQVQTWIKQIYQETNRLINLVQNWLNLAHLEQSPYNNLQLQNLDLKELILSAWNSLSIIAKQENIEFKYEGLENVIVEADLNYFTQVFVNLFDNSIKHCSPSGLILVNVSYDENEINNNMAKIDIIDSGNGFNTDDLPHIFERLYRGDKSRSRGKREGSGLGLSIVKNIVEAHKGKITAQNHPETGGAWLKIIIPFIEV